MKKNIFIIDISLYYYYTAYNNKNEIIKQNNPVASDKATVYVGLIFI